MVLQALEYRERIMSAAPESSSFEPLMTLYLTDGTTAEDVREAKAAGVVAYKLYPAGATTNSQSGVTDIDACLPALQAIQEVTSPSPLHHHSVQHLASKPAALLRPNSGCSSS